MRLAVPLALFALLAVRPGSAAAQQDLAAVGRDTARVTYRTQEIVFLSAGRAAGLSVGDTVAVMGAGGQTAAHAVLVSVAQHTASATLIPPNAQVAVGQLVRFRVAPPATSVAAAAPAVDSTPLPGVTIVTADTAVAPQPPAARLARLAPQARWRGSIQLDQVANSSGGPQSITSYQTNAALALTAPLTPWLTFTTRSTSRWRSSSASPAVPGGSSQTMVYQAEARIGPPGSWWNMSLGRFVPADAPGLGFLDGARLEVRPGSSQRLGVVGGLAPDVFTLAPSSAVRRVGGYWALTTPAFSTSLGGAAEWEAGQRRRTWYSAQSYWAPSPALSFSFLTDIDYGSGWQSFRGFQVTDLSASVRAPLPFGFHAGLSFESHAALQLWDLVQLGDTLPLPGRLSGFTGSIGREVLGSAVEMSASYLRRTTDPSPTFRGTVTIFNRRFMVVAMGQHGDLFDYGSLLLRVPLPLATGALTTALGFAASATVLPSGSQTLWRYGVRPEISWRLGGGFYFSTSAEIGRYAGQTSTFIRGGVSYQIY